MSDPVGRYYVYVYRDPRTGFPIYVGKGSGNRVRVHWEWRTCNFLLARCLVKIKEAGLEPIREIVGRHDDEAKAFEQEKGLIELYGRRNVRTGTLCNMTDGGEGATGNVVPPEVRAKISASLKGIRRPPQSAEQKAKHSERMTGRTASVETRLKMSSAGKGRTLSIEHKKKLSAIRLGMKFSVETRAKISAAVTAQWQSPELRAKLINAARNRRRV